VALPTDKIWLILVSSINIGEENAMEIPMSTSWPFELPKDTNAQLFI
jgi:hypothetical protein